MVAFMCTVRMLTTGSKYTTLKDATLVAEVGIHFRIQTSGD